MANPKEKTTCQNRFKDIANIKESFNQIWIALIDQFERNGPSDLQTEWGDV